ncbi:hypothetical protein [Actinomyces vulturis]|uniref:hypothetical protein n=1 Tax=Actinomyces vulturis TaxID=1857645 RepID=UPI0008319533|nr:hypothetical protein [Actinomyces vulturis]
MTSPLIHSSSQSLDWAITSMPTEVPTSWVGLASRACQAILDEVVASLATAQVNAEKAVDACLLLDASSW